MGAQLGEFIIDRVQAASMSVTLEDADHCLRKGLFEHFKNSVRVSYVCVGGCAKVGARELCALCDLWSVILVELSGLHNTLLRVCAVSCYNKHAHAVKQAHRLTP